MRLIIKWLLAILVGMLLIFYAATCAPIVNLVDSQSAEATSVSRDIESIAAEAMKESKARNLQLEETNELFKKKWDARLRSKNIENYKIWTEIKRRSKDKFLVRYEFSKKQYSIGPGTFALDSNGNEVDVVN